MKLNLAVIFGGKSVEHEISILSAQQAIAAVDKEKYHIIPIYLSKEGLFYTSPTLLNLESFRDLDRLIRNSQQVFLANGKDGNCQLLAAEVGLFSKKILAKVDIVFPITHGTNGEDGTLQGLLEMLNVPYVGSNVVSSGITFDKVATKMALTSLGVPMLPYVWFYSSEWLSEQTKILEKIEKNLKYPLIVKPSSLGSSVGVSAVNNKNELEDAIDLAVSLSSRVLIEPKIENLREINCSVLGDHEEFAASVCEEPIRSKEILSYSDKYLSGAKGKTFASKTGGMESAKRQIPANIPVKTSEFIQDLAKKVFYQLDLSGVVRIDFLIDQKDGQIYLCEVNTIPGSLSFYLWQPMGIDFKDLTSRLIELALKKHREKNNLIASYSTNILQSAKLGIKS
ncbi:MAG: D-alanine--D-alanine ligase family protein [Gammaproteobacteria bacterium]